MEIKGREYQYIIYPSFNKVKVEIYRVEGKLHLQCITKEFGHWYKGITQKSFDDARAWGEFIINGIKEANK